MGIAGKRYRASFLERDHRGPRSRRYTNGQHRRRRDEKRPHQRKTGHASLTTMTVGVHGHSPAGTAESCPYPPHLRLKPRRPTFSCPVSASFGDPVNTALFERNRSRTHAMTPDLSSSLAGLGALHSSPSRSGVRGPSTGQVRRQDRGACRRSKSILRRRTVLGLHRFRPLPSLQLPARHVHRPASESVAVTRALKGGDHLEWEGLRFQVIDSLRSHGRFGFLPRRDRR